MALHSDPHFNDLGYCVCACRECTSMVGCVCLECPCDCDRPELHSAEFINGR